MANTIIDRSGNDTHNTHLAVQKWSRDLFKHSFAEDPLKALGLYGKGPDSVIQIKNDLLGEAGDKVQFDIFALLIGNGQGDDGVYETNEEALVSHYMDVLLHERGHSTKTNGKMTQKRTIHDLRRQGKIQLGSWLARKRAADVIAALSGLSAVTFAGQITGALDKDASSVQIGTVNKVAPVKGPTAIRWFGGGQTTAGTLARVASDLLITSATNHLFGTVVLSFLKRMAERTVDGDGDAITPLKPVMVKGQKYFVFLADEFQIKALRNEAAWLQAQREAGRRGNDNPIFSGAEGIFDGVIVKKCQILHRRTGAGTTGLDEGFENDGSATIDKCATGITVARGLFLGAQAGCLAQGQYPTWDEEGLDYKTKKGIHTDVIYGVEKTNFDSQDFGCITCDTAVAVDA